MGASGAAASAGVVAVDRAMGLGVDSGSDFGEGGEAAGLVVQAGGAPEGEALISVGYPAAGLTREAIQVEDLAVEAGAAGAAGPVVEDEELDLDWGPAPGLLVQAGEAPEAEALVSEEYPAAGPAWEAIRAEGLVVVAGAASSGLGLELDLARGRG